MVSSHSLFAPSSLVHLVEAALALAGERPARLVARSLVDAEVRGQQRFGLRLLNELPNGSRDELAACLADGSALGGTAGPVSLAGRFAPTAVASLVEPARRSAARNGISLIRLRDIGPFGRLAPYVAAVAELGAIGLLTMSSRSFVAPHGGHSAALGTNPFALAVPTGTDPLVIDTATSAITAANWHDAQAGWFSVPPGALIDSLGGPSNDALSAVAIAPRGGRLGTSLGVAIEGLTAGVTGQLSDPDGRPRGGLLMVIEPDEDASAAVDELSVRLLASGGHLPGQPVPWPDTISIEDTLHQHVLRLADLA